MTNIKKSQQYIQIIIFLTNEKKQTNQQTNKKKSKAKQNKTNKSFFVNENTEMCSDNTLKNCFSTKQTQNWKFHNQITATKKKKTNKKNK